jgi:hypothetical protein
MEEACHDRVFVEPRLRKEHRDLHRVSVIWVARFPQLLAMRFLGESVRFSQTDFVY